MPRRDDAPTAFGIFRHPVVNARRALLDYLAPRIGQGAPEYVRPAPALAKDAFIARWTDGVQDVLTWTTARTGGLLLEHARNPHLVEGPQIALASRHLERVVWAAPE